MFEVDAHAYDEPRYEAYLERVRDEEPDDAYEPEDPKHLTFHERMSEIADTKEER